jgi:hypothetical protein
MDEDGANERRILATGELGDLIQFMAERLEQSLGWVKEQVKRRTLSFTK